MDKKVERLNLIVEELVGKDRNKKEKEEKNEKPDPSYIVNKFLFRNENFDTY
jgi:hypothetical protein